MTTPAPLLHLMPLDAWRQWEAGAAYEPASLRTEGFMHCSGDDDVMLSVANAFYADTPGELVVVSLDAAKLTSEIRWEAPAHPDGRAAGDDEPRFPHVYGPLDRDAVVAVRRLRRAGGRFVGYTPLSSGPTD